MNILFSIIILSLFVSDQTDNKKLTRPPITSYLSIDNPSIQEGKEFSIKLRLRNETDSIIRFVFPQYPASINSKFPLSINFHLENRKTGNFCRGSYRIKSSLYDPTIYNETLILKPKEEYESAFNSLLCLNNCAYILKNGLAKGEYVCRTSFGFQESLGYQENNNNPQLTKLPKFYIRSNELEFSVK